LILTSSVSIIELERGNQPKVSVNQKVYIITTIFNPFNYSSRNRLYPYFAKHMKESGVELFTVEAAFGDQPFRLTHADNPMNLQVRTDQVLWHKERMLNLGFQKLIHVVPDAQFVGWYDSDVTHLDPDWAAKAAHALHRYRVIQPFGQAISLDAREEGEWMCPSSLRAFLDGRGFHQRPPLPVSATYKGHPGLAWMARRSTWEQLGGLYDVCAAGSADTVMSNCLKGDWSVYLPAYPSEAMRKSMAAWQAKCDAVVQGHVGFIHGALAHHFHGQSGDRGYEKRWQVLSFHQFDPAVDVVTDPVNGMLKWAGNKPQLEQDVKFSLSHRNEDNQA
jgi:hypothetical protein